MAHYACIAVYFVKYSIWDTAKVLWIIHTVIHDWDCADPHQNVHQQEVNPTARLLREFELVELRHFFYIDWSPWGYFLIEKTPFHSFSSRALTLSLICPCIFHHIWKWWKPYQVLTVRSPTAWRNGVSVFTAFMDRLSKMLACLWTVQLWFRDVSQIITYGGS